MPSECQSTGVKVQLVRGKTVVEEAALKCETV